MIDLYHGDCLDVMDKLIYDGVIVDAIICDLPYGTTANKWDSIIPLDEMWRRLNMLIKPSGAIVLFGAQPFTSLLVSSNLKDFKYSIVYQKTTPTGHLNANKMPMRNHEDILVFYKKQPVYNPQKTKGHIRKTSSAEAKNRINKKREGETKCYGEEKNNTDYDSTDRFPLSVIKFSTDKQFSRLHPTQKPAGLMSYLVKTYTNENDTVLDMTMGSGTTGIACKNTDRNFIGIELDEKYFKIAKDRIEDKGSLFLTPLTVKGHTCYR